MPATFLASCQSLQHFTVNWNWTGDLRIDSLGLIVVAALLLRKR